MMEDKVERESLKDLETIVKEAKNWKLNLVVIGGYAIRAYTKGYRYTKDIGGLIALLKDLGYKVKETQFGLKGKKKLNGGFINLDISIHEVWDVSTDKRYPADEILKESRSMEISGFFEKGRKIRVKASVASLEDLIILKLMTRGRERDVIDIISLLIDRWNNLDLEKLAIKCSRSNLSRHIRDQALGIVALIRSGEARKIWLSITGQRLMRKTETELIRHLREIDKRLSRNLLC